MLCNVVYRNGLSCDFSHGPLRFLHNNVQHVLYLEMLSEKENSHLEKWKFMMRSYRYLWLYFMLRNEYSIFYKKIEVYTPLR